MSGAAIAHDGVGAAPYGSSPRRGAAPLPLLTFHPMAGGTRHAQVAQVAQALRELVPLGAGGSRQNLSLGSATAGLTPCRQVGRTGDTHGPRLSMQPSRGWASEERARCWMGLHPQWLSSEGAKQREHGVGAFSSGWVLAGLDLGGLTLAR